jgi:hypothetical protein
MRIADLSVIVGYGVDSVFNLFKIHKFHSIFFYFIKQQQQKHTCYFNKK